MQGGHIEHGLGGHARTIHHKWSLRLASRSRYLDHHHGVGGHARIRLLKEFAAGFMQTLAFQLRTIEQNRGSSGLRSDDADSAILT